MKTAKSNIDHLRDILEKYQLEDTTEAKEFLDAIEKEEIEYKDKISSLKEDMEEEEKEEVDLVNSDFVGLDTINWSLENGNLVIQQKMEYFIEALQKQNAVVPV